MNPSSLFCRSDFIYFSLFQVQFSPLYLGQNLKFTKVQTSSIGTKIF